MALTKIELAYNRQIAGGAEKVDEFSGATRDPEQGFLEEGDTWTFPDKYDILKQKIEGTERFTEYILLEVTRKDGTTKDVINFYPSIFHKTRRVVKEDGTNGDRMHVTGSAYELFRGQAKVNDGMNALKGKKCVCTKLTPIKCYRYGTTELRDDTIPQIDLAN